MSLSRKIKARSMNRSAPLLLALLLSGCRRSAGREESTPATAEVVYDGPTVTLGNIIMACAKTCGSFTAIKDHAPLCVCRQPEEVRRIERRTLEQFVCCTDCANYRERFDHEVVFNGMFCKEVRRLTGQP